MQVAAVQEGIKGIIPLPVLNLMTAKMFEEVVCGAATIDIQVLKKIVRLVENCILFLTQQYKGMLLAFILTLHSDNRLKF